MATTEPVNDWSSDFDIFDADFVKDPYPIWEDLRPTCPVAHSDRWGGSYMPSTFDTVTAVAHDVENFTSFEVSVAPVPASYDERGQSAAVDHRHRPARAHAGTAPDAAVLLSEGRRAVPGVDARPVSASASGASSRTGGPTWPATTPRQIPPRVIADILGIDPDMSDQFTEWVQGVLELGLQDPELRERYRLIIQEFFDSEIERPKDRPRRRPDLVPARTPTLDGGPVPMHVIRGNLGLMLIAGIDTTWSSIGSALWHLATHPEDRQRLVDEPDLLPIAVEEFLRAYSPVTMARLARNDTSIGDTPVKKGERVLLSFPAANRDPEVFEDPEEVIIDRAVNRHVAFGVGIHRCLGSNLARMEMQVAISEFLAMVPEFEVEDPDAVTWAGGQVRGPRYLPVTFPKRTDI